MSNDKRKPTDEQLAYHRERIRKYRAKQPHLPFYTTSRYLAKKAGVFSDLTKEDAADIYYTPDICVYCGKERSPNDGLRSFHIDHVIPMRQGGPNSRWNLAKVCNSCNSSKNFWSLIDFKRRTPEFTDNRYNAVVSAMAALSDRSVTEIRALLDQSHAFETAHEREKTRLLTLLNGKEAAIRWQPPNNAH